MAEKWDGREVAELIGANSRVVWKEGDNFFTIKVCTNGEWTSRKVYELSEEETKKLKSHGPASGMNFGHCLFLASRYWKEFKAEVCGYRIVPSDNKDCPVSALFYSKD